MYRVYSRDRGVLVFEERRFASALGRLFTLHDCFSNLSISIRSGERQPVEDWLYRYFPPPDAALGQSAEYLVRTAARPSRPINPTHRSYWSALLCLVRRTREQRQVLSVEIETYKLGDRLPLTRHVNGQTFFHQFQRHLFALLETHKELSNG